MMRSANNQLRNGYLTQVIQTSSHLGERNKATVTRLYSLFKTIPNYQPMGE